MVRVRVRVRVIVKVRVRVRVIVRVRRINHLGVLDIFSKFLLHLECFTVDVSGLNITTPSINTTTFVYVYI